MDDNVFEFNKQLVRKLRVLKIFCTLDILYGLLERDNRLDGKFYFLFKQILYSKHAYTTSSYAQG